VEALVVRVVDAATLPVGGTILGNVDDSTAVIVGRDEAGWFARSAICTHACCIVSLCTDEACADLVPTPDGCATAGPAAQFALCTCHGSRFQLSDGAVLNGPATRALPAYALTMDGNDALVDTGAPVDPTART
jgi:Rieske Fe-S protein